MRRHEDSSHRLLALVPLRVLSRPHSTVPSSPERYDNRYEEKYVEENAVCLQQLPRGHCGGPEEVAMGDTSLLTIFSVETRLSGRW
jgi:hypothetical protein